MRLVGTGEVTPSIGGRGHPGQRHRVADVVFAHAEIDDRGAPVAGDFQRNVERHAGFFLGDLNEVEADPVRMGSVSGDSYGGAAIGPAEGVENFFAQAAALIGVIDSGDECVAPTGAGPGGDEGRFQRRAGGDVGVLVRGDATTGRASGFHQFGGFANQSPGVAATRLEVRDMDRCMGLLTDLDRLGHGFEQHGVLTTNVTGIEAPELTHHFGERGEFGRVAVAAGHVDQAGRQAPGTVLHPLPDQFPQTRQFFWCGEPIVAAEHDFPNASVRNEMQDVRPGPARFDLLVERGDVGRPRAAVSGDNRGAALQQVVDVRTSGRIDNRIVAVRVEIDEPRSDDEARAIDFTAHSPGFELTDRDDLALQERDIAHFGFGERAIADQTLAKQEIAVDCRGRFVRDRSQARTGPKPENGQTTKKWQAAQ